MNPITDELIAMAKKGQLLSREYVRRKINAVKKREAGAPWHLERVKECLKRIVEYAGDKKCPPRHRRPPRLRRDA